MHTASWGQKSWTSPLPQIHQTPLQQRRFKLHKSHLVPSHSYFNKLNWGLGRMNCPNRNRKIFGGRGVPPIDGTTLLTWNRRDQKRRFCGREGFVDILWTRNSRNVLAVSYSNKGGGAARSTQWQSRMKIWHLPKPENHMDQPNPPQRFTTCSPDRYLLLRCTSNPKINKNIPKRQSKHSHKKQRNRFSKKHMLAPMTLPSPNQMIQTDLLKPSKGLNLEPPQKKDKKRNHSNKACETKNPKKHKKKEPKKTKNPKNKHPKTGKEHLKKN